MTGFRDRITELRRVRAGDLRVNAKNWREHPEKQLDALRGILSEVGFAGAELVREREDGSLELIDGHARASLDPDAVIPVLVTDLTEFEADKILFTFDPIAEMAKTNHAKLQSLAETLSFQSPQVMWSVLKKGNICQHSLKVFRSRTEFATRG